MDNQAKVMNTSHKISFVSTLIFLFLLPLFVLPGSFFPLAISKTVLLTIGSSILVLTFLLESMKKGSIQLPATYMMWAGVLLPLVYLISAVTSSYGSFGIFGYNLEIGTAASILLVSVFFVIVSLVFNQNNRIMEAYGLTVASLSLVLVFGLIKILSMGKVIKTGILGGTMGNTIGSWTDYAMVSGLIVVMVTFALQMLSLKKTLRLILYGIFTASLFMLAVINFSAAWQLVFGISIVSLVYFLSFEKRATTLAINGPAESRRRVVVPILLAVISLLFVINPHVSSKGTLGATVSTAFHLNNIDVRPSLGSTLSVSGPTLKSHPFFGSGPNTFLNDWLLYRPQDINATPFWGTAFPYGVGFIPTQLATVGIVGMAVWLAFLVYFVVLGIKVMGRLPEARGLRFILVSSFTAALFLWVAQCMYQPSIVVLTLAFIFTGFFIGGLVANGLLKARDVTFNSKPALTFTAMLVAVVLGLGTVAVGFGAFERFMSVAYFQRALILSSTPGAETNAIVAALGKASKFAEYDLYYAALSRLEFSRAQAVAASTSGTAEQNKALFEEALSRSIAAAQAAVNKNPQSYENLTNLGAIYASLVPKPFAVPGAYENAKGIYERALAVSPHTPEVPLLLARLEFDKGNVDAARGYIQDAISKKKDYAEAYYLLTQIEASENKLPEAIQAVQTAAVLSPDNAGIFFQLGLLNYLNKNYQGAVDAFTRALTLVPEYANAKYYNALSLDALGKRADAVALFEDLHTSNPDNELVTKILANLKANRDPFAQGNPTKASAASRNTPPIPSTTSTTAR